MSLSSTSLTVSDVSCSTLLINGINTDPSYSAYDLINTFTIDGTEGMDISGFARVIDPDYVKNMSITGNELTIQLQDPYIDTGDYSVLSTFGNGGSSMYLDKYGNINFSDAGNGQAISMYAGNLFNIDVRLLHQYPTSTAMADTWNSAMICFKPNNQGQVDSNMTCYLYCRGYQYRARSITSAIAASDERYHICCDIIFQGQTHATHVTRFSDRRLKKNIVPIKNAMESINKLNIVHYIKTGPNGSGSKKEVGVIAQEVEATNDLNLMKSVGPPMNTNDYYTIEYSQLHYIAIQALQELHDEYEKFKEEKNKKLLNLMERITALENKKK